jgi:hypothetical protein
MLIGSEKPCLGDFNKLLYCKKILNDYVETCNESASHDNTSKWIIAPQGMQLGVVTLYPLQQFQPPQTALYSWNRNEGTII